MTENSRPSPRGISLLRCWHHHFLRISVCDRLSLTFVHTYPHSFLNRPEPLGLEKAFPLLSSFHPTTTTPTTHLSPYQTEQTSRKDVPPSSRSLHPPHTGPRGAPTTLVRKVPAAPRDGSSVLLRRPLPAPTKAHQSQLSPRRRLPRHLYVSPPPIPPRAPQTPPIPPHTTPPNPNPLPPTKNLTTQQPLRPLRRIRRLACDLQLHRGPPRNPMRREPRRNGRAVG